MPTEINAIKGDSAANSYATLAEADVYFGDLFGYDDFKYIDISDKKRLLLTATKDIEKMSVTAEKQTSTQALKFPIKDLVDGYEQAKEACLLQAYHLFLNFSTIEEQVSKGISNTNFNGVKRISSDVYRLLAGFTDSELPFTIKLYRG